MILDGMVVTLAMMLDSLDELAIVGSNMYVFFNELCDAVFKKPYFFNAKLHDPNEG